MFESFRQIYTALVCKKLVLVLLMGVGDGFLHRLELQASLLALHVLIQWLISQCPCYVL